jgi:hypothetical protein
MIAMNTIKIDSGTIGNIDGMAMTANSVTAGPTFAVEANFASSRVDEKLNAYRPPSATAVCTPELQAH